MTSPQVKPPPLSLELDRLIDAYAAAVRAAERWDYCRAITVSPTADFRTVESCRADLVFGIRLAILALSGPPSGQESRAGGAAPQPDFAEAQKACLSLGDAGWSPQFALLHLMTIRATLDGAEREIARLREENARLLRELKVFDKLEDVL